MTVHDPIDAMEQAAKAAASAAIYYQANKGPRPSGAFGPGWGARHRAPAGRIEADEWSLPGWKLKVGIQPHYGEAKRGKTTGVTSMVIVEACIDLPSCKAPTHWNRVPIMQRGCAVIFSGEERYEAIEKRCRHMIYKIGYRGDDIEVIMSRIIIIAPLSMDEAEWPSLSPALTEQYRISSGVMEWLPSPGQDWLWEQIEAHNAAATRPEDRVVNLVIDSVTSIASFSSVDEMPIGKFLFHINRKSIANRIAVILIAHTQKDTKVDHLDPHAGALIRLKGSGAWSAISRIIVEWRRPLAQHYEGRFVSTRKELPWYEAKEAVERGVIRDDRSVRDLVVCEVADGNVGYSRAKLWMKMDGSGGLEDLQERMAGGASNYSD